MRVQTLLLVTHGIAAATVASMFVAASRSGTAMSLTAATLLSLMTLAAVSWFTSARIRAGLTKLEAIVADHENSQSPPVGLTEFDQSAQTIGECASHWETVAANTRQQANEIQAMMRLLNRRDGTHESSHSQLRGLLAGLGNTLHSHLVQIERGTAEVEQYTQSISDGSESQGHAVIKTTTYVEQLSTTIGTVSTNADSALSSIARTGQSASAATGLVRELIAGMNDVRADSQTCEKKLGALCDPFQQISAILATISEIAARTDLLALNASIEAIRAGEHGRGFAIVADEVRKLAEQATDATQEVSSLIDAMQMVTQESIHRIGEEREQVEMQIGRASAAEQSLKDICKALDNDAQHVRQIAEASTQQLRVVSDVVLAVEQISKIAKANRGGAESVCWTMKSLSKTTPQFGSAIERLRNCGATSTVEAREQSGMRSTDHGELADVTNSGYPVAVLPAETASNMIPVA